MEQEFEMTIHDLLAENKAMDALQLINSYIPHHRYEASAYYWLGIAQLFDGKCECALNAFEEGARFNPRDSDILFGLGIANFALGRDQEGVEYLRQFSRFNQVDKLEIMGRASMLACARMYLAAMFYTFLASIDRDDSENDAAELSSFADQLFSDYVDYSLYQTPALFETRLLLENVEINDELSFKEYLKKLIYEGYWKDALYFYFSRRESSCDMGNHQCEKYEHCIFCLCGYAFGTEIIGRPNLLSVLLNLK